MNEFDKQPDEMSAHHLVQIKNLDSTDPYPEVFRKYRLKR